ncbi:MAG: prolyl oligopeptidase family serine peptidase [Flavobacteriaceae bacterium]
MTKSKLFLLAFTVVLLSSLSGLAQANQTDDPYLWLEEVEGEKALEWVRAQNAISEEKIAADPLFEPLRQKYLEAANDKDKIIYPDMVGDHVYNLWQDEVNERGLWRRMPKADFLAQKTTWEVVLDLDALSKKEGKMWVFAGATWLQPDNRICLLALADGGTDENLIREFNVETKSFVENGFAFPESKGEVSWISADKVLVNRDFGEGTMTTSGYPRQVRILERGGTLADAEVIFETAPSNVSARGFSFYEDGRWYVGVYNIFAFYNTELYFLNDGKLQKLEQPKDANFAGFHKQQLLLSLQSDWTVNDVTYKKGTLVSYDLFANVEGKLKIQTVYEPNEKSSYVSALATKDFLVVNAMENVQNKLIKYTLENGNWVADAIEAPEFGSIYLIASDNRSNDYYFMYSNFITPRTLYHATGETLEVVKKLKDIFDTANLEVEQHFTPSKDGTLIPYFMVHRKDMAYDGSNPTLVYAYGGFNISEQPDYSYNTGLGWLSQGGVYVLANIRGGGEYGPAWHEAGMKEKKQNGYDDFYAVCEDLIHKKVTSPEHLGAYGWSNGGLMAGVLFTQRPDLFKAAVVGAPLLDMKRYSKLLAGASWMGEYGNPDIPEEWEYIQKYSPYHNIHADRKYPEVFFVTSTKDDRVHPGHARKMAAKMNAMGHPLLYQETIEGGHGAASTNAQRSRVSASMYTYLNMKLNPDR